MTVNEDTGCLLIPEIGTSITAFLSRSQFLRTPAFSGARVLVQNEPHCSYSLPGIQQADTKVVIVLQFRGEELVSLSLFHDATRFGSFWSDWSAERERARKLFHEHWLATELRVPPGTYPWGGISSDYDDKGGFSSIKIRYAISG
jgi:hypothetical protein